MAGERGALRQVIDLIVRDVAELPDRTSPDDWPEAMLVTDAELRDICDQRFAAALPALLDVVEAARRVGDRSRAFDNGTVLVEPPTHLGAQGFWDAVHGLHATLGSLERTNEARTPPATARDADGGAA